MLSSLEEAVRFTIVMCQQHSTTDDPEMINLLSKAGVEPSLAKDLVAFVPLGFTRAFLATSGVGFQSTYLRMHLRTQTQTRHALSDQPLFTIAYQFAQEFMVHGYDQKKFFAVAGRSSEMHVLNQFVQAGSNIKDIDLSEPMVLDHADDSYHPKRPWWRFWQQSDQQ